MPYRERYQRLRRVSLLAPTLAFAGSDATDLNRRDTTSMSHLRANMAAMTFDRTNRQPPARDLFELEQQLIQALTDLWGRGWMPADVMAAVSFERSDRVASMASRLILAEHLVEGYHDSLSPQWLRQLNSIPEQTESVSPLSDLIDTRNADSVVGDATHLYLTLANLPELQQLCDLPGTGNAGATRSDLPSRPVSTPTSKSAHHRANPDILRRVRAILAKAEATEFEAEAEAFTAKAQTMIATHSLQSILDSLDSNTVVDHGPEAVRLAVERPYDREKFGLLAAVAQANRCRAILHTSLGLATVVGFHIDLDAVELLYTSLLVQATHSMRSHGSQSADWGGNSTRAFRRSFLRGFSGRVGERLDHASDEATRSSASGPDDDRLLPVLASRAVDVDSAVESAFPRLTSLRSRARIDGSGYTAGVRAADRADLGARRPLAS